MAAFESSDVDEMFALDKDIEEFPQDFPTTGVHMSQLRIVSALFAAAVSLAACDRPTVVAVPPAPSPSPAVVAVPGPAGPTGSTGAMGTPGSPGGSTTVVVTPAASAASN